MVELFGSHLNGTESITPVFLHDPPHAFVQRWHLARTKRPGLAFTGVILGGPQLPREVGPRGPRRWTLRLRARVRRRSLRSELRPAKASRGFEWRMSESSSVDRLTARKARETSHAPSPHGTPAGQVTVAPPQQTHSWVPERVAVSGAASGSDRRHRCITLRTGAIETVA